MARVPFRDYRYPGALQWRARARVPKRQGLPAAIDHSNGAVVSLPTETPSTRNSTRTTARLSVADATMTVDPGTLAPSDGEDTATAGGVTSRTVTVTVSVPTLPSASRTVRVTTYLPGVAKTYDAVTPGSVCIVPSMNVHV